MVLGGDLVVVVLGRGSGLGVGALGFVGLLPGVSICVIGYVLLGFFKVVVVWPEGAEGDGPGVNVPGCEAGFGDGAKISCLDCDVYVPVVGDGVQFLGLDYCVYFLGLNVGVQVRGLVDGGQILGLPLRFPLVYGLDDSVQVCCVVGGD